MHKPFGTRDFVSKGGQFGGRVQVGEHGSKEDLDAEAG